MTKYGLVSPGPAQVFCEHGMNLRVPWKAENFVTG